MSESPQHTQLVRDIIEWVQVQYGPHHAGLYVLNDLPGTTAERRPWRIDGFVPDVYAATTPATFTILGEAKCPADFSSPRTRQQFQAFLSFLRGEVEPWFVVATPWEIRPAAKRLVRRLQQQTQAENVTTLFLAQ